jgi:hypothetical protein
MPEALRRAYRDALRLHEEREPRLEPSVDTLEALDRYEEAWDVWITQWLRLWRGARPPRGAQTPPREAR